MVPLQNFATGVLAEIIRRQPPSPSRTSFAWTVAVGPALSRTTVATLADSVLTVRARDPRWAKEVHRAADTILLRMQHLLGPACVARMVIES
jgi:hypothetical protein